MNEQSDFDILIDPEEIDKVFWYKDLEGRNRNKNKYKQYLAIPVSCNNKTIGLFDVVAINDSIIGDTKAKIDEIASKYILPYTYFILILHKLEKALLARPKSTEIDIKERLYETK